VVATFTTENILCGRWWWSAVIVVVVVIFVSSCSCYAGEVWVTGGGLLSTAWSLRPCCSLWLVAVVIVVVVFVVVVVAVVVVRPTRTVVPGRPYVLLLFLSYFFSTRDLRGSWADLREILPHSQKHVQFTNACPKIWRPVPKKIWGRKTRWIWPDFGHFPNLSTNISGTDRDI